MPKISTNQVKIYHKDIEEYFTLVVMYNQTNRFYIEVPDPFTDIINHLSDEELETLKIIFNHEKRSSNKKIISAETEEICIDLMKKAIKNLIDKRIVQRDVIIVFYNPKDECTYGDHRYNKEHPQIGMQIGLTYAIESTLGDKKVYSTYETKDWFGDLRTNRTEIRLWNQSATVIPDTPQNRETLERLYDGFVKLNEKMKEFTKTPDSLIAFIDSKLKILGQ